MKNVKMPISESAKNYHEELNKMLTESNAAEIYTFIALLNALGFRVAISPKETEDEHR